MYVLLVIDLDEAYCAKVYSDAEIVKIFNLKSEVPHKHRKGGQSAARFSRIRDNEITLWFKRLDEHMKNLGQGLSVAINPVYRKRFDKKLSTYNKEKVVRYDNTECSSLTGVYEYINLLEAEKKNTF